MIISNINMMMINYYQLWMHYVLTRSYVLYLPLLLLSNNFLLFLYLYLLLEQTHWQLNQRLLLVCIPTSVLRLLSILLLRHNLFILRKKSFNNLKSNGFDRCFFSIVFLLRPRKTSDLNTLWFNWIFSIKFPPRQKWRQLLAQFDKYSLYTNRSNVMN
jgi:hypothetical protein